MKKLKRWNRGLAAAAVLIIGVILFQIIDQTRFQSSLSEISALIQDYEAQSSEALSRGETAGFLEIMEQYWEDPGTVSQAMRYSTTRSSFYELLDDETVFLPLACRETLQSCKIRKSGPAVCQAELTLDSTVWLDRYGSYLGCFGAGYAYNESAEDYTQELEAPDSVKNGSQVIRQSSQLHVLLQLSETEGTWKINYSQMYTASSASELADREEVPV